MSRATMTKPAVYSSEGQRWNAVLGRDARADGTFYYSVKTTGVYCRPSCAARLPRRENVAFHQTCEDAERAGFRPCQRCRPRDPDRLTDYARKVAAACRTIETAEESPSLETLAQTASMSRFHFHRVFTQITGLTPKAYATARRAERVRTALARRQTVTEAIYDAGFNANGRFYAKSAQMLGMRPRAYRNGGDGATIQFAVGKCSLGLVLVACSGLGVCAILLGDDAAELTEDLRARFPKAQLNSGDEEFSRVLARVIQFVDSPKASLGLPLDLQGTAFQRRVWQALQKVSAGETTSYATLANRIGAPKAVRAVAGACAANPVAVAVPCHRVIRSDGKLSGYRWGIKRKRMLLDRETKG